MQKNSAFLWRPFVQRKTKETFCFAKFYLSYNYGNQVIAASLAQAIEALNGADVILFCRDTGSKQGRPIFVFLFFICFSTYFKNQNIYLNKTCSQSC